MFTGSQKNRRSKAREFKGNLAQQGGDQWDARDLLQDGAGRWQAKSHDANFKGKWRLEPFFADSSLMALVSLIWH